MIFQVHIRAGEDTGLRSFSPWDDNPRHEMRANFAAVVTLNRSKIPKSVTTIVYKKLVVVSHSTYRTDLKVMGSFAVFVTGLPSSSISTRISKPLSSGKMSITSASKSNKPRSTHCIAAILVTSVVQLDMRMTVSNAMRGRAELYFKDRVPKARAYLNLPCRG